MSDPFHKPLPGDSGLPGCEPPSRRRRWVWWIVAGVLLGVSLAALRIALPPLALRSLIRDIEAAGGRVTFLTVGSPRTNRWHRKIPPAMRNLFATDNADAFDPIDAVWLNGARFDDTWLKRLRIVPNLQWLNLSGTRVTSEGMNDVARHTMLYDLCLAGTRVDDAGIAALSALSELRRIDLTDCPVTDAALRELSSHHDVSLLKLRGTRITDRGMDHLASMSSLWTLDLAGTAVTDRGFSELSRSLRIGNLEVGGADFTDAALQQVAGLATLLSLEISNAPVTDAGLPHLKRLPLLHTLTLERTQITNGGIETLCTLTTLSNLNLEDTAVEGDALCDLIRALPVLGSITVSRRQLSDSSCAALQRDLPGLYIHRRD